MGEGGGEEGEEEGEMGGEVHCWLLLGCGWWWWCGIGRLLSCWRRIEMKKID